MWGFFFRLAAFFAAMVGAMYLTGRWVFRRMKPRLLMGTLERQEYNLRRSREKLRKDRREAAKLEHIRQGQKRLKGVRTSFEDTVYPPELRDEELRRWDAARQMREAADAAKRRM